MKKTLQECKEILVKEFNPQNIFPTRKDREDLIELANKMYYEQSEWVSVKDALPESGQCVLLYSVKSGVAKGAWISAKGHFEQWRWNAIMTNVTHWQPLPNPPQK